MDAPIGPLILLAVYVAWKFISGKLAERRLRASFMGEPGRSAGDQAGLLGTLDLPNDVDDPAAWDRYWDSQFSVPQVAAIQLMFAEMFSDDRSLVDLMRRKGLQSVLCVGHGVSREPAALARAGLAVVALDISPRAAELSLKLRLDEESLHRFIDPAQEEPGGRVEFVSGNLLDTSVCPGPFDVIIERRTVQLFGEKKSAALEALAARLATPGVLFSHAHDGAWGPSQPRVHSNEECFRDNGWTIWHAAPPDGAIGGQAAWLFLTTG